MPLQPFFENKNRFIQIIFLLLFIVGGMIIFSALGQLVAMLTYGFDMEVITTQHEAGYYRIIQSFSSVGTFAVPALLFSYCTDKRFFSYNALNRPLQLNLTCIVIVLSVTLIPLMGGIAQWNEGLTLPESFSGIEQWMRNMEETNQALLNTLTLDPHISILLLNIFVLALIPAFGEELLFRGTLQPFFVSWTKNRHIAIWITAFIFSAIHFQFLGFLPRFLLGAYLGYLLLWSGSLRLPVIAHFLHNTLSLVMQFSFMNKGIDIENMQVTDIRGYIPLLITSSVITFIGIFLLRKKRVISTSD